MADQMNALVSAARRAAMLAMALMLAGCLRPVHRLRPPDGSYRLEERRQCHENLFRLLTFYRKPDWCPR